MARIRHKTPRKTRERGLLDVFGIGFLGLLSVGLFLLPGLLDTLPSSVVTLAYVLAALAVIPTIMSLSELSTAMPRSGGGYFFIDRSLGAAAGWVGGLASWMVYFLECAFIFVSIGILAAAFFEVPVEAVAVGLVVALGGAQLAGMRRLNRPRRVISALFVGALAVFAVVEFGGVWGVSEQLTTWQEFVPALAAGHEGLAHVTGLVFIAFAGFIGIGSIAEHVEDAERNIPRGMLLALAVSAVGFGVVILGMDGTLARSLPVGEAGVSWAMVGLLSVAGLAMIVAAHDRLSSSTRLLEKMADDESLPQAFAKPLDGWIGQLGLLFTLAATVAAVLFVDLAIVVQVASALTLMVFGGLNLAVIVMRESKIDYYHPSFKSPLYPWLQLAGIGVSVWLVVELGWAAKISTLAVVVVGLAAYFGYARKRVERSGAVYHVFARLGDRQSVGLNHELRGILSEKGLHDDDPYDDLIENATTLDLRHSLDFAEALRTGARMLGNTEGIDAEELEEALLDELALGLMPIYDGVAVPHHLFTELEEPAMLIMRMRVGATVSFDERRAHIRNRGQVFAAIFLLCPDSMIGAHLRMLSQLALKAEEPEFLANWLKAGSAKGLKQLLSDGVSTDSGESHDDLLAVIDWEDADTETDVEELGGASSEELVDTLPPSYVDRTEWLWPN